MTKELDSIRLQNGKILRQGEEYGDWFVQSIEDAEMRVNVYLRKEVNGKVIRERRQYMVGNCEYLADRKVVDESDDE